MKYKTKLLFNKGISTLFIISMLFTFSTCVQAASADVYKDVKPGDWYYDDIVWAIDPISGANIQTARSDS